MKKKSFCSILPAQWAVIAMLILFSVISIALAAVPALGAPIQCRLTAENYAVEVFLNKDYVEYNLGSMNSSDSVLKLDNSYIFKSFYGNNLYTILSEQAAPGGSDAERFLSVKLQLPVKKEERNVSYLRITSFKKFENADLSAELRGWAKVCSKELDSCTFEKGKISITIEHAEDGFSGYIDFLDSDFYECSGSKDCSGECMYFMSQRACVPQFVIDEISSLVQSIGISNNFKDFTISRKTTTGSYTVYELVPEANGSIKWQDAMKDELSWLKSQDIIHITERDIAEIAILSEGGRVGAGRVYYGINEASMLAWTYSNADESRIADESDCDEFYPAGSSKMTGLSIFSIKTSGRLYMLIPIIFIALIGAAIAVLFAIAKIMDKISEWREKPRIRVCEA
ncbi:MAG TPA: hypothetical protein VJA86_02280 [Candidatus Nanoarchaeia archaeon]|nr:hypothetical protein [Candidatus Nanoarchaeia archaeon]